VASSGRAGPIFALVQGQSDSGWFPHDLPFVGATGRTDLINRSQPTLWLCSAADSDLICSTQTAPANLAVDALGSADFELFVAEVGHDFHQAADGGDVAVQDVDAREVPGLDLRDAADGDTHSRRDAALGESLALADLGQTVRADLGNQGVLAGLDGVGAGCRDVLVANLGPTTVARCAPSSSARSFR
jgi:hypothetical protein